MVVVVHRMMRQATGMRLTPLAVRPHFLRVVIPSDFDLVCGERRGETVLDFLDVFLLLRVACVRMGYRGHRSCSVYTSISAMKSN